MESEIITATWPLMVHLSIYWLSRKEKQLLSGVLSLPATSPGYGLAARASRKNSLIKFTSQLEPTSSRSSINSALPGTQEHLHVWLKASDDSTEQHSGSLALLWGPALFFFSCGKQFCDSLPEPGTTSDTASQGPFFSLLPLWGLPFPGRDSGLHQTKLKLTSLELL